MVKFSDCISLQTGSIIIGGMSIFLFNFIKAIWFSIGFFGLEYKQCVLGFVLYSSELDEFEDPLDIKTDRLITEFVFSILQMFASSSLIFGSIYNKQGFLVPVLVIIPLGQIMDWIAFFGLNDIIFSFTIILITCRVL